MPLSAPPAPPAPWFVLLFSFLPVRRCRRAAWRALWLFGALAPGLWAAAWAQAPSGNWRNTADPGVQRYGHAAVLLGAASGTVAGQVLQLGGAGPVGIDPFATVHRFNPRDDSWTALADMAQARRLHTATALANGGVLVAGGTDGTALATAEEYQPAGGGATVVLPPMSVARYRHTATLLLDGRVLVAGGNLTAGAAEVYTPAAAGVPGTWAQTGPVPVRRENAKAVLLPSGKVLVAGGISSAGPVATAELYDPATNSWTATGSMAQARTSHTLTLLHSGQVLVAGGASATTSHMTAELYDPSTGTWSAAGTLAQPRLDHSASLLPSGEVLVAAGEDVQSGGFAATTERFDPATQLWRADASLHTGRSAHAALVLADDEVLVLGGTGTSGALSAAERYHDATPVGTWEPAQGLPSTRSDARAVLLDTGKVLVMGGYGSGGYLTSADLYDPAQDQWSPAASMQAARYRFEAAKLGSGRVLVTGGWTLPTSYMRKAEVYDAATDTWTAVPDMAEPRSRHSVTPLPDGRALVVGGEGPANTPGSAELFDPATNTWSAAANPLRQRKGHAAVLLASGKVLVVGSDGLSGASNSELYDPAADSWTDAGSLGQSVGGATLTLLPSGEVLAVGGYAGNAVASVYLYHPVSGWKRLADMYTPRAKHTAQLLADGRVLVAGGDKSPFAVTSNGFAYASAMVYEPQTGHWTEVSALRSARASLVSVRLPSGRVLAIGPGTAVDQYVPQFTVSPTATPQGYFLPWNARLVREGDTISFALQANAGFLPSGASGCGGTLAGSTYTTGPISQHCTVAAAFALARTVTATAGAGGSISPSGPQAIVDGATASFTVTPQAGYQIAAVTGCGGTLVNNTYTTGAVAQNCTVAASFTPILHAVTATAQSGGSISPSGVVNVAEGQARAFTVTPGAGYRIASVAGCGGTLAGNTFTTAAVMGACSVQARFETLPANTATGSGPVTVGVVGGSAGCQLDLAHTGPVAAPAPYAGAGSLPHGAVRLRLVHCQPGETVRVAVTFPSLAGLTVKKYGPTPSGAPGSRYYDPVNLQISGNTATYDVTDGGWGDDSFGALDGTINDPVVAVPLAAAASGAVGIPTLSGAGLGGLSLLLAGLATWQHRRRAATRADTP